MSYDVIFHLSNYTLKSDQLITIWCAKFKLKCLPLNIHLSHSQKHRLSMPVYKNSFQRRKVMFSNITFAIFRIKMLWTKLPPWVLWNLFSWWNHQIYFKMVYFSKWMQNLEIVNFKCVTYNPFGSLNVTIVQWIAFENLMLWMKFGVNMFVQSPLQSCCITLHYFTATTLDQIIFLRSYEYGTVRYGTEMMTSQKNLFCISAFWIPYIFQISVEHDEKPPQPKFGGYRFMGARDMAAWIPTL